MHRACLTVHARNYRSICGGVYDHGGDAGSSDGFRAGDDQSRRCSRTAGMYREVRGVFFRKSGNGALNVNRGLGAIKITMKAI